MQLSLENLKKQYLLLFAVVVFAGFSLWWVLINVVVAGVSSDARQIFAASYQFLALFGAIVGFTMSHRWGGYKSLLGKSLIFFSAGLLLQSFGQSVYSYYIFFQKIEVPYPSIGDIGFFGSVIAYILGAAYLSRVAGFRASWKSLWNKFYSIAIPAVLLVISYMFFLKGYQVDWSDKLRIFLDFGYPLGEAIYVAIAIIMLIVSRDILGGVMRKPVIFLIFALIVQYFSDFTFLYQASQGSWSAGGFNDYLYCFSYFLMAVALIHMGSMFTKIKNSN